MTAHRRVRPLMGREENYGEGRSETRWLMVGVPRNLQGALRRNPGAGSVTLVNGRLCIDRFGRWWVVGVSDTGGVGGGEAELVITVFQLQLVAEFDGVIVFCTTFCV